MGELFTNNTVNNDIVDISLETLKRKKFRIDQDDNRILELDTTDLSIVERLQSTYTELVQLIDTSFKDVDMSNTDDGDNSEKVDKFVESFNHVNSRLREMMDYIFNSNVSEICAPTGSMLDPINGKFRFEHIFDCLLPLYEKDISVEMRKFSTKVQKHTDKYIKK